jgi:hypothetical protein
LIYSSDNIDTRVKYADSAGSASGLIQPTAGRDNNGIIWPNDPGGGWGDNASIKYYVTNGENCTLNLKISNDVGDTITFTIDKDPNQPTMTYDGNLYVPWSISEGGSWLSDKYHPKNGNIPSADSCNGTFTLSSCISRQIIVNWQIASNGVANGARIFTNNWWYQGRAFINIAITSFGWYDGTGGITGDWCGRIYLSNAGGVIAYYVERQSGSLTVSNSWDGSGGNYITVDSAPTYSIGYKIYG